MLLSVLMGAVVTKNGSSKYLFLKVRNIYIFPKKYYKKGFGLNKFLGIQEVKVVEVYSE